MYIFPNKHLFVGLIFEFRFKKEIFTKNLHEPDQVGGGR